MALIYQSNAVHRNNTQGKTQWADEISISKEEEIFRIGETNSWQQDNNIFSVLFCNKTNILIFLDRNKALNFAHFSGESSWHGWPADVKRSPKDLPPYCILQSWVGKGYTSRSKIFKLMRRQICAL